MCGLPAGKGRGGSAQPQCVMRSLGIVNPPHSIPMPPRGHPPPDASDCCTPHAHSTSGCAVTAPRAAAGHPDIPARTPPWTRCRHRSGSPFAKVIRASASRRKSPAVSALAVARIHPQDATALEDECEFLLAPAGISLAHPVRAGRAIFERGQMARIVARFPAIEEGVGNAEMAAGLVGRVRLNICEPREAKKRLTREGRRGGRERARTGSAKKSRTLPRREPPCVNGLGTLHAENRFPFLVASTVLHVSEPTGFMHSRRRRVSPLMRA